MKSSFHKEDEFKDKTLPKPRETASKVLHADVNSQSGSNFDENDIAYRMGTIFYDYCKCALFVIIYISIL